MTSSPSHFSSLRALGATHVYDYNKPLPSDVAFSYVLDGVGDAEFSVEPISRLNLLPGAKVGVFLPIRKGKYGKVSGLGMELETHSPAKCLVSHRIQFWQKSYNPKSCMTSLQNGSFNRLRLEL